MILFIEVVTMPILLCGVGEDESLRFYFLLIVWF
jgi:hypothetical protein